MNQQNQLKSFLARITAALVFILIACPSEVRADDSGSCGANVIWSYDSSTQTLTISGSGDMSDYSAGTLPWYSYRNDIQTVIIESGVTSIGKYAFSDCITLSSVTIPSSVTSIGQYGFFHCLNLSSVTIPSSVTSIEKNTFWDCITLSSVTIPSSVTSIGNQAFRNCTSLSSITIPFSVTSIEDMAFQNCTSLKTVYVLYYVDANPPKYPTLSPIDVFQNTHDDLKIWVPSMALDTYKAGGNWSTYKSKIFAFGGYCGDPNVNGGKNVIWNLTDEDNNGTKETLTITGSGAMACYSPSTLPWDSYKGNIQTVIFESGVTSIGGRAFYECTSLSSVTIPSSVTLIDPAAFEKCTSLSSITIPASVTDIRGYIFYDCTSLSSINVDENNPTYKSVDGALFSKDGTKLFIYPAGKTATSYTIPDGVTSIDNVAFYYCTRLSSIIIPFFVESIGRSAFCGCSNLKEVYVLRDYDPTPITTLGDYNVFSGTHEDLVIWVSSSSLETYKKDANWSAYNLSGFGGYWGDDLVNDGYNVIWNLTDEDNNGTPETLSIIGTGAMNGDNIEVASTPWQSYNEDIKTVIIRPGVTSIGKENFRNCTSLLSVTIPSSVTSIGKLAFWYCESLLSVDIPASVTSIGNYAFTDCTSLSSVNVDDGNPNYKSVDGVLFNKDGKTLIHYPAGKTATSYTIPSSVTSIEDEAFYECKNLSSVTIPSSVTSIGTYLFEGCTSLSSVTIPASVTSIGCNAFADCTNLKTINVLRYDANANPKITTLGHTDLDNFKNTPADMVILVPLAALETYKAADGWKTCADKIKSSDGGFCGDPNVNGGQDVKWEFDSTSGTLTISGNDAIVDYANNTNQPWSDDRDKITSVDIEEGVTAIGENAFYDCKNLTAITIPTSVTSIGNSAFQNCLLLKTVYVMRYDADANSIITGLGTDAFNMCHDDLVMYVHGAAYKTADNWKTYADKMKMINTVTPGTGITASGTATLTYNGTNYYAEGTTITFNYSGVTTGYNLSFTVTKAGGGTVDVAETNGTYSFTMPDDDVTVAATLLKLLTNTDIKVGTIADQTYTGSELKPAVTVKDGETDITDQCDFTYSENISVGTAKVTITAKTTSTAYSGEISTTFEIVAADGSITPPTGIDNLVYSGAKQNLIKAGSSTTGTMEYSLDDKDYSTNIPQGDVAKEYTVYYRVKGDANHKDVAADKLTVTISPKTVTNPTITLSQTAYDYDGTAKEPTVTSVKDGETVIPEEEYTISYENNKAVGTATVKIADNEGGNYTVSGTAEFEINAVSSLTIKISEAEQLAYYSPCDLDFKSVEGVKVYMATGYDKTTATIWLSRVYDVPAETGFLLVGDAGEYEIPVKEGGSTSYYQNLFKGTLNSTTLQATEGAYTNYYLSEGAYGVGFYKPKDGGIELKANRAYLSVPTEMTAVGKAGKLETITVDAAGQLPYYSSESLDFTDMDEQGLRAYTAIGYDYSKGTIWLTRVKKVPAETGILIVAPKGSYDVPTASVNAVYANMLKGSLTASTIYQSEKIDGVDYTNYYLSDGDSGVGFYKVSESGVELKANRSYLPIRNQDGAAHARGKNANRDYTAAKETGEVISMHMYGDGATGIGTLNADEEEIWYNLHGLRISKPTKSGVYIKNGHKVIIK